MTPSGPAAKKDGAAQQRIVDSPNRALWNPAVERMDLTPP
jgi:hypothetical protein